MQLRLYGIMFLIAGIIMFIVTFVQWLKILSFRDCRGTTAAVTGVDARSHYTNGHSSKTYSLIVSYTVDGVAYERKLPCDAEDYNLGAGRAVEILYKERNPKRILLNAPERHSRAQRILWIITLALLAIGAVMILLAK